LQNGEITIYALTADLFGIPEDQREIFDFDIMNQFEDFTQRYYSELKPR